MKRVFCFFLIFCCFAALGCKTTNGDPTLLGIYDYQRNIDFLEAVKAGNLSVVNEKLRGPFRADVNTSDKLNQTALMWACWNGDLRIIDALLKERKLDVTRKSRKDAEIVLEYNALFCYIMSNNITPDAGLMPETAAEGSDPAFFHKLIEQFESGDNSLNPNKLLYRLIMRNPKILSMSDMFGENVIHKIIRSNKAAYFYTVFAALIRQNYMDPLKNEDKIRAAELELCEKESKNGEPPLLLAIRLKNRPVVKLLIDLGVTVNDQDLFGAASENTLFKFAFDEGRGSFGIFMDLAAAKFDRKHGPDIRFEEFISRFAEESQDETSIMTAGRFRAKYEQYKGFHNNNALNAGGNVGQLLVDEEYDKAKNELLSLLARGNISSKEIIRIDAIIKDFPEFADDQDGNSKKSILELAIENHPDNSNVFKTIFNHINLNKTKPAASNKTGDFFIAALVSGNTGVMKFILDEYKRGRNTISSGLWGAQNNYNRIEPDPVFYSGGGRLTDPLRIFLQKSKDSPFDGFARDIVDFYMRQHGHGNNAGYVEYLIGSYLNEDIPEKAFSYMLENYQNGFAGVYLLDGEPLLSRLKDPGANPDQTRRRNSLLLKYLELPNAEAVTEEACFQIQAVYQGSGSGLAGEILTACEEKITEFAAQKTRTGSRKR